MLLSVEHQTEYIRAIRAAVPEFVVNARVDVFLNGSGELNEAVERANAYLAAGADCTYPILAPVELIADLASRIEGPINILLTPRTPSPRGLQAFGVARATWGAGLATLAYAEADPRRRRRFRLIGVEQVAAAVRAGRFGNITSVVVSRDGQIVWEEYGDGEEARLRNTRSCTKTVASLLVGLHDRGRCSRGRRRSRP